jgi:hypothetical protein
MKGNENVIWLNNPHPTARVVGRYEPRLKRSDVQIMSDCPYEHPRKAPLRHARRLTEWGLLEEDPQTPGLFRTTPAGTALVRLYRRAGWL